VTHDGGVDMPEMPNEPGEENEGTGTPELPASTVITVTLTGAAEVPDSGDEDGTGTAILTFDTISNTVCYKLETENIDAPTMAHIHEGAEGASGDAVVTLFSGGENVDEGCVTPESRITRSTNQEATIIETILANPSDYYVNVHNETFSGGAIRGQLAQPETAAIIDPDGPTALDLADEPLVEYSIYLPITAR